jgi:hypothetical protein
LSQYNTHEFGCRRPIALTAFGLSLLLAISNFQFYFENTLQASEEEEEEEENNSLQDEGRGRRW